ncbi:MAG: FAD binding domain-containing protein [Spirochaetia bacterium]|nr:FAD binding domain-containing protein [Spirochaetales bacterium]MDX9783226.1 FAD binding domain-containing protein [Spirochaetia bacterium]
MKLSEVFYPQDVEEILGLLRKNPDILILAGGTNISGSQPSRILQLPEQVASIAKVQELRKTIRTEQFIEMGSCTTFTGILSLAPASLPEPLGAVIKGIGNRGLRNIATIGGNLCCKSRFLDLWPFLSCMDAQVEFRSPTGTRWASVGHLCGEDARPLIPSASILSRLRIPLYNYDFVYYRKLGNSLYPTSDSAMFVCMANIARDKVEDFRLVFSGEKAFRLKDKEMSVSGRKISTPKREVRALVTEYKNAFEAMEIFDSRPFTALLEDVFARIFL